MACATFSTSSPGEPKMLVALEREPAYDVPGSTQYIRLSGRVTNETYPRRVRKKTRRTSYVVAGGRMTGNDRPQKGKSPPRKNYVVDNDKWTKDLRRCTWESLGIRMNRNVRL